MSINIVVLAGIETVRDKDGKVLKLSQTFMNNARTYRKDRPKDNVNIIDARDYMASENPIEALMHDVRMSFGHDEGLGIDELVYIGHSDPTTLYVFSRVCKDHPDEQRFLTGASEWVAPYNKGASIRLISCQAGGTHGKKATVCLAQDISNTSGLKVYAYTSRCAQIRRKDGGFEQRPDYPGFALFLPENSIKDPLEKQTPTPS